MNAVFRTVQPPTPEQISVLIETAFWASLRSDEGRATRVLIGVGSPRENFPGAVAFATPAPYDESQVAKLAPAVPLGGCLLVSSIDGGLQIWGFGDRRPETWFYTITIDIRETGTVHVGVGPFQPFAVLNGRSNPVFASTPIHLPDYFRRVLMKSVSAKDIFETQAVWRECLALRDLARMIVADGHGGIVLVVPSETGAWLESLNPFAYRLASPDTRIRDKIRQELREAQAQGEVIQQLSAMPLAEEIKGLIIGSIGRAPGDISREIRATASLAKVDGAIVITRDLQLLGFGAKIAVPGNITSVLCIIHPKPGSQNLAPSALEDLGGTRHQSAARFAGTNRDTVALVISQDRHMSVMHWDESIRSVAVLRNVEWWL